MCDEITYSDWQTKHNKICERGKHLFETGLFSDCKFIVGNGSKIRTFPAHKLILSMASPVFEAMFYGPMGENNAITVPDIQTEAFECMLQYIYTDKVNLSSTDLACELCYAAHKYLLPFLVKMCSAFIFRDVDSRSAFRALEFGILFNDRNLQERCLQIIEENASDMILDAKFCDIQLSTLLKILDLENLLVGNETFLLYAILRWAQKECIRKALDGDNTECLRMVSGDAINKIRFLTITPTEFSQCSAIRQLLNKDEEFTVYQCISSKRQVKTSYPEYFCRSRKKRTRPPSFIMDCLVMCCNRTIVRISEVRNKSQLCCRSSFMVECSIYIHGIKVPTQTFMEKEPSMYQEHIGVALLNTETSQEIMSWTFNEYVTGVSTFIKFPKPVKIKREKVYTLQITFHEKGVYPIGNYSKHTNLCNNVLFTFGLGEKEDNILESALQAIHFSLVI
uniref:BTB domain-containing protein n=1 Tax=Clastoptera arizonana TaxID=38151 RepID=A0A1B6DC74_9HEMI